MAGNDETAGFGPRKMELPTLRIFTTAFPGISGNGVSTSGVANYYNHDLRRHPYRRSDDFKSWNGMTIIKGGDDIIIHPRDLYLLFMRAEGQLYP